MSKKDRSTLVLLICIALVGAFIWIQESYRARMPSKTYQKRKIFDLDPTTLKSLQLKSTNSVINCVKDNGVWMIGDPQRGMGRADVSLVYRMLSGLNSIGKGTLITAKQLERRGLNVSEYGFVPPSLKITAIDNQGERSWEVGRKTPLGDMVYLKTSDIDDIYTVPSLLWSIIPSSPDQLRDRVLFPGEPAGARRLEIRGPSGFIRIVKDPTHGWRLQQPITAQADPLELGVYLDKLFKLRIEAFIADNVSDLSVYGLQGETKQISLSSADGSSRMLLLGDEIPNRPGFVYARRADDTSVFSMQVEVLQLLDVPANRFRDARVVTLQRSDITSIYMKRGAEQLSMSMNADGAWKITSPFLWNAETEAVANFLSLWDHIVITEFNVFDPNADEAEWIFEFGSTKTSATNRIEILQSTGRKDGLLVRRDTGSSIFQINLPEVPTSIINPLVYKDKRVWQLKASDIDRITLLKTKRPRQVVARSHDGTFRAAETNGNIQVDTKALDKMLNRVSKLDTPGYIALNPKSLDIYGLADPYIVLNMGLSKTNELGRVLLIGRESTEGYYSMVKGRDVVFYLDADTVDALSADLIKEQNASTPP